MKIYGFAMIRNGVKFDYPFRESLYSLRPLVEKIHIAIGKSGDGTEEALAHPDFSSFLHIIPTIWDDSRTDRGHIFSEQTNIALNSLRASLKNSADYSKSYGIYLQSDELFHEEEIPLIKSDLQKAFEGGYDAVAFRYFHFWQEHNQIAINKKWYPLEIRAIKLDSPIASSGDAQGFTGQRKVYQSDAHIYHYGHVRDNHAYQQKMDRMIQYYHPESGFSQYKKKWHRKDRHTETIFFLGNHPAIMRERMKRIGGIQQQEESEKKNKSVYFLEKDQHIVEKIKDKIIAEKIIFVSSIFKVPFSERNKVVLIEPNLLQRLLFPTNVPCKMRSKLARPWKLETVLMLKLSEKGIGLRSQDEKNKR